MSGWAWLAIAAAVALFVLVFYLSMTAGRLDRLHKRIDTATLALDAHLLRRSSVALELASSGSLDPAASMLIGEAAHWARTSVDADPLDRAQAETDLTQALLAALADPDDVADARANEIGAHLLDELDAACLRVEISRRFLNDTVRAARQVRHQWLVRVFRLAGHTPYPMTWEMDDTRPPSLTAR